MKFIFAVKFFVVQENTHIVINSSRSKKKNDIHYDAGNNLVLKEQANRHLFFNMQKLL